MRHVVEDRDLGFKNMQAFLRARGGALTLEVVAGFRGNGPGGASHQESPELTVAQVAAFHEFGAGDNPERSFMRTTFDENVRAYDQLQRVALGRALDAGVRGGRGAGMGALRREYGRIGLRMASDMQRKITAGLSPPLQEATIRRKGSSKPLIDTGQTRASIDSEVRRP